MTRVILHVGIHKTGTTAIQAAASDATNRLHNAGWLYPTNNPIETRPGLKRIAAHHDFAHALADTHTRFARADGERMVRAWLKAAAQQGRGMFISSESISRHTINEEKRKSWESRRLAYLARLRDSLDAIEIVPIIVLRRQDDYIRSLFQEHVMNGTSGGSRPFHVFREERSKTTLRFLDQIEMLETVFGQVKVMVYEDLLRHGNLVQTFFSDIGIECSWPENMPVVRKSLSPGQTIIKQFLNHGGAFTKKNNRTILEWLRTDSSLAALIAKYDLDSARIWERDERIQFIERYTEENREILRRFLPGRERLFPPLSAGPKEIENGENIQLNDQLKAEIVLALVRNRKAAQNSKGMLLRYFRRLAKPWNNR
ncbi:MAG: hypothetical protein R6U98_04310 [Pirellulaceae bacterium]